MGKNLSDIKFIQRRFRKITPRWVVLLIDLSFVLLSCLFSIFIVKTEDLTSIYLTEFNLIQTAVVLVTYALMSRITKSYWGIIRYTGFEDANRLFIMTLLSSVALYAFSWIAVLFQYRQLFSFIEIIQVGIFSFTFIMLERMSIKSLYRRVSQEKKERKRVIVLGSAVNSIVLANAIKNEIDGEYEPVALLSLQAIRKGDNINGMPVIPYDTERIPEIFKKYDSKTLIILATHMELMKKGAADIFLENGIELLLLNQFEQYHGDEERKQVSSYVYNINIEDLLGRDPIRTDNENVNRNVTGHVVMVTGAAGSIGSEIVRQLLMIKAKTVVLLDQAETPMHSLHLELKKSFPDADIHLYIADVQNKERVRQAFEKYHPQFVFHAAAYKHVPMMENNPTEAILTNVSGTRNVADLAVEYNVEKFVMVSTDKAVNPTNVMGCSKRIAEIYVQSLYYSLCNENSDNYTKFITTRFGNVLGSNGSVVPLFKEQIAKGGPVTVTHRDIIRYFMTIPEACNLVLEAGSMGQGGEIFIFDMGEPVKIYDLAKRMIRLSGLTPDVDIKIEETGLRPGEKLYEELLNDKEKTIPTYHNKIMIAQVRKYTYENVLEHINPMIEKAQAGDARGMVLCMKQLVPEFKSRNSVFEELDKLIEQQQGESIA